MNIYFRLKTSGKNSKGNVRKFYFTRRGISRTILPSKHPEHCEVTCEVNFYFPKLSRLLDKNE